MTNNAQRFIDLQNQVNNQIDTLGQADYLLANELDRLGDQLTIEEIDSITEWFRSREEDLGPEYDSAGFTEDDRIVNGQYRVIEK